MENKMDYDEMIEDLEENFVLTGDKIKDYEALTKVIEKIENTYTYSTYEDYDIDRFIKKFLAYYFDDEIATTEQDTKLLKLDDITKLVFDNESIWYYQTVSQSNHNIVIYEVDALADKTSRLKLNNNYNLII